jgi:class 3 adenylate cyclase
MKAATTLIIALAQVAALSACGHNTEQKAATGAATGMVIAGPVGAAVGGAAGAVAQKVEDANK